MLTLAIHPQIEACIRRIVEKVYVQWLEQEPADLLIHVERNGTGYSTETRPYRGTWTWILFSRTIEPTIQQLETEFEQCQPELLGFLYTGSVGMRLQAQTWIGTWMTYLDGQPKLPLATRIDQLIADLKLTLGGGGKVIATTVLVGLSLPAAMDDVRLEFHTGTAARLHRMTDGEFSKIYSQDVMRSFHSDAILFGLPETVLLYEEPANFALKARPDEPLVSTGQSVAANVLDKAMQALTLTKEGYLAPTTTTHHLEPRVIPASFTAVLNRPGNKPLAAVQLLPTDIDTLKENLGRLLDARPEISIACKRLIDAEGRLNPADAVVDAAIGLETLLLRNRQELTFRVKLNYAFLAPFGERPKRVSELNELYNWRGKIVHGSAGDADLGELSAVAAHGIQALRFAIVQFLRDKALRKDAKLDNEYWIDRIIRS